jgi:hypothetical protein
MKLRHCTTSLYHTNKCEHICLLYRVLTMAYHNHNYWVFGLFPSSGILGTRKHDVSETASVSVLMCGGGRHLRQG